MYLLGVIVCVKVVALIMFGILVEFANIEILLLLLLSKGRITETRLIIKLLNGYRAWLLFDKQVIDVKLSNLLLKNPKVIV